jgi:hypothetical protein
MFHIKMVYYWQGVEVRSMEEELNILGYSAVLIVLLVAIYVFQFSEYKHTHH